MKKLLLIFIISFSFIQFSFAQRKQISYGFFGGAAYSKMTNIEEVFIPPNIYKGFETNEEDRFGAMAGFFFNWKYEDQKVSLQPEIFYSQQATRFNYNDVKGLNYKIDFKFNYVNVGVLFKFYPVEGLYVGAGPYVALNVTCDAITYSSNGAEVAAQTGLYFEPDIVQQKFLKQALEGKNYFQTLFGAGYEFNNGISIAFKYHLGLSDALETKENGFRFIENKNKTNAFSLSLGYSFDFEALNNF